ncbi:MAG: methyltransferase domain-containing protein [Raineya sp.]|nr:methyltransferase domain-containing protein [Raineya sp.]
MENARKKVIELWSGEFGNAYTDRNIIESLDAWNNSYKERLGISRLEIFREFLNEIPRDAKILEVGCNVGYQLMGLKQLGFRKLYGIDINSSALRIAKKMDAEIDYLCGDVFDIPFKDAYFDVVIFSGLLVLLPPETLDDALSEIVRCTKKFIFGHEYYADQVTPIHYRGHYIWKLNFVEKFLSLFSDIRIVKEKRYSYLTEKEKGNIDTVFLLWRADDANV